MSIVSEIVTALQSFKDQALKASMPTQIVVPYPPGTPAAGVEAGRFLLRLESGDHHYQWEPAPLIQASTQAIAENIITHAFLDLESFVRWLPDAGASVFLEAQPFSQAALRALNEGAPERGAQTMLFQRHPSWLRWSFGAGQGAHKDLTHVQIADLLLDNAEDLTQKEIAKMFAVFRAARTVEYVGDHDTGAAMGVRVNWKGGSAAETVDAAVPREFTASIPAFTGAWAPGKEPHHEARFRVRVIPPRGEGPDAQPKFRILWLDAQDFELDAAAALKDAVAKAFGSKAPVYLGTPHAQHFVMPGLPSEAPGPKGVAVAKK